MTEETEMVYCKKCRQFHEAIELADYPCPRCSIKSKPTHKDLYAAFRYLDTNMDEFMEFRKKLKEKFKSTARNDD